MFVCICICLGCTGQAQDTWAMGRPLPDGAIAVRNSRHPPGPALIYTRADITAFLTRVKNGEFDDLYPHPSGSVALLPISH